LIQSAGAVAAMALRPELSSAMPLSQGDTLDVGVIGVGRQGRAILAELQKIDGVNVKAICDVIPSRLRSGQRRAADADAVDDYKRLLDNPAIQAVFVATPTHQHRAVTVDALSAGHHVYCEAPLASTVADCQAISAAARTSKKIFATGMLGRSNPVYKLARTFYRSNAVHDLVSVRAQYHRKTTWRTPSPDPKREAELNWRLDPATTTGLMGEFGTHQFDVIHWFIGQYPTRVSGFESIRLHDDGRKVADTASCDLHFPNGAVLQYQATLCNSYGGTYEVLHGTNAAIKLAWTHGWMFKEADAPTLGWEVYANRQQFHNDEGITLIAEATKLAAQGKLQEGIGLPNAPLHYGVADFVRTIAKGGEVACSVEEGMRAAVVGILAHQAVSKGQSVSVDTVLLEGKS
jgi:predicted dehydrogenase